MTYDFSDVSMDFSKVYSKANEFLATSSVIETFPFKLKALIEEQSDIRLCSYSKAIKKFGISIEEFGSESACLMEYNGASIIFYDNTEDITRGRFNLSHEFAHHVLGHKMNLKNDDPLYHKQEIEANCFAGQLLMPEQIIRKAVQRGQMTGVDYIKKSFGVSEIAAQKRKSTLAKYDYEWRKREEKEFDDVILFRFSSFIEKIAPVKKHTFYYDQDSELSRQMERDSWLDTRSRWS